MTAHYKPLRRAQVASILENLSRGDNTEWMEHGACIGSDPDAWHPAQTNGGHYAKTICNERCPVRDKCLAYALADLTLEGIWGGTTRRQRLRVAVDAGLTPPRNAQQRASAERRQTARELAARGMSPADIASDLGVKTETVEGWFAAERADLRDGIRERAA